MLISLIQSQTRVCSLTIYHGFIGSSLKLYASVGADSIDNVSGGNDGIGNDSIGNVSVGYDSIGKSSGCPVSGVFHFLLYPPRIAVGIEHSGRWRVTLQRPMLSAVSKQKRAVWL